MPRGVEDRDRWIPGKSGRRCKNASVGNRHAQLATFCPAGHPAAREVMAPPHAHTYTCVHAHAHAGNDKGMERGTVCGSVGGRGLGVARGTSPGLRRPSSSRGVRNNTLVVGAANSARNYPDARHLLGSCRPVGVPTGRITKSRAERGRRYEVTFLEFLKDRFCRCFLRDEESVERDLPRKRIARRETRVAASEMHAETGVGIDVITGQSSATRSKIQSTTCTDAGSSAIGDEASAE